jgi:4-amino-4-deoxy-L-arabinose transferase-like glycosyltransferase
MFDADDITAITDYALAAASLGFAIAVGRSIKPHNRVSAWFWCAAFVAAAAAGAAGGAFHFLDSPSQDEGRQPLWTLIIVSMGAFGAFVTAGIHAADVQRKDGTILWLAAGIAVTLMGAAVQRLRLPQSVLDHNGLYHLIQIVGLYLFYRCALTVHDRPGVPPKQGDAQPEVARSAIEPS